MWDSSKGSEPLLDDDVIGHLIKIPFHFIEHHLLTMMSLVDNGDYLDTVLSWVCLHFTHTTLRILYTIGHLLIPRLAGGLLITQRREIELRIKVMPRSVHSEGGAHIDFSHLSFPFGSIPVLVQLLILSFILWFHPTFKPWNVCWAMHPIQD